MFPVPQLLDFLEASPSLQWISLLIQVDLLLEDVPPERVIVLPHVETFYLEVANDSPGCEITTHISCPSAKCAQFFHALECAGYDIPEGIYPSSNSWNAITRQYTKGTVEQVALRTTMDKDLTIGCLTTFWSSDGASLELCYIHHSIENQDSMNTILNERLPGIFSQAFRTIRDQPLLANIRYLHIEGGGLDTGDLELATNDELGNCLDPWDPWRS